MGYTLTVGEIEFGHPLGAAVAHLTAGRILMSGQIVPVTVEQAPAFPNDYLPRMNKRVPSYGEWSVFCKAVGLYDLFYGELLKPHPGIVPITERHTQAIVAARTRYQQIHPHARACFGYSMDDEHLARLMWLEWWFQWACANCRRPGICNR